MTGPHASIRLTLKEWWQKYHRAGHGDYVLPYDIYIFWDGQLCLYVGRSAAHIQNRIRTHIVAAARGYSQQSDLSKAIEEAFPDSRLWEVEMRKAATSSWVEERQLIGELMPIYNIALVPHK